MPQTNAQRFAEAFAKRPTLKLNQMSGPILTVEENGSLVIVQPLPGREPSVIHVPSAQVETVIAWLRENFVQTSE